MRFLLKICDNFLEVIRIPHSAKFLWRKILEVKNFAKTIFTDAENITPIICIIIP